jgi:hypothetical protein
MFLLPGMVIACQMCGVLDTVFRCGEGAVSVLCSPRVDCQWHSPCTTTIANQAPLPPPLQPSAQGGDHSLPAQPPER